MRLGRPAVDLCWRRGALGRLAAWWEPPEAENEQLRDLLGGSPRPPFHRCVALARVKPLRAQREPQGEMLDDLCGCPLPGGPTLPLAVRAPPEGAKHELRELSDRSHIRHRVRRR